MATRETLEANKALARRSSRMRYSLFIFLSLIAVSAWAGTWRDDFNDGDLDGWKMVKGIWQGALMPNEGNWHVEDGMVIGGEEAELTWHALYVSEGLSWSDYTVEVSVKISKPLPGWADISLYISPEDGRSSGLIVQEKDESIFAQGYIYIHPATYIQIAPQPFEMKPNRWYRLKIEVKEKIDDEMGIVQCFIDGQAILQFQGYRKGAPGFSAYQTVAMFDDFVVTGPDIPGAKAVNPKDKLSTTWGRLKRE